MTQLLLSLECQQLLLLENSTGRRLNSLKCGLFLEPSTIFCSVLDLTQYSYVMTVTLFSTHIVRLHCCCFSPYLDFLRHILSLSLYWIFNYNQLNILSLI